VAAAEPITTELEPQSAARLRAIARRSLLSYSPALVLVAIMVVDSSRIADPDLWGHLRFGGEMLRTHHLALRDPYAYSAAGRPWVSHEWLSEVLLAYFYGALGVFGLNLLKLACSAALVVLLALALAETGASTLAQFAILMLAGVRLAPQMQYRPQIFTYALLAGLLALLARDNFRHRAPLGLLIPMFALWANLHGGFVVGLGALGLYAAISAAEDWWCGRGLSRAARLGALWIACALATLVTPYGFGTWRTVAHTIANPAMLSVINEWQPLIAATAAVWREAHLSFISDLSLFGIFGGLAAALALHPRGGDFALVAIAATLIAASFVAVRNVPLGLIAATVPLARHASLAWTDRRPAPASAAPERATAFNQAVLVTIAILIAAETGFFSRRLRLDQHYPAGAVAFIKSHRLAGNILSDYGWNDYLIYHLAPASHVFIDSRYEMIYPERVTHDFLEFQLNRAGALATLAAYPNDFVLVAARSKTTLVMKRAPGWTLIYGDPDAYLYARSNSAAAHIAPVTAPAVVAQFP
jgi:hypothetical protein